MKITIDEEDILYVVSAYLQHLNLHKTAHVLEQETSVSPYVYGRDINFARSLTMRGRWVDLKEFLSPLKRSQFDYDRAVFEVDKQAYLELLEGQTQLGDEGGPEGGVGEDFGASKKGDGVGDDGSAHLVDVLKKLEGRCTQQEFHTLCYTLTVSSLSSHPDYAGWTRFSGRAALFDTLLKHLAPIFPDQVKLRGRASDMPKDHLSTLCKQAVLQQLTEHKYQNPNARVPEEYFASVLNDRFTYQKNPLDVQGRRKHNGKGAVSQSMPDGAGMCEFRVDPHTRAAVNSKISNNKNNNINNSVRGNENVNVAFEETAGGFASMGLNEHEHEQ